jgi:hypothetical protein
MPHRRRDPGRLPVLFLGQVASPERVCDEMRREDRRGNGKAEQGGPQPSSGSAMPSQAGRNQTTYSSGVRTARNATPATSLPSIPMRAASGSTLASSSSSKNAQNDDGGLHLSDLSDEAISTCPGAQEGPAPALPPGPGRQTQRSGPQRLADRMVHRRRRASRGWDRIGVPGHSSDRFRCISCDGGRTGHRGCGRRPRPPRPRVPIGCGAGSPPGPCPATGCGAASAPGPCPATAP